MPQCLLAGTRVRSVRDADKISVFLTVTPLAARQDMRNGIKYCRNLFIYHGFSLNGLCMARVLLHSEPILLGNVLIDYPQLRFFELFGGNPCVCRSIPAGGFALSRSSHGRSIQWIGRFGFQLGGPPYSSSNSLRGKGRSCISTNSTCPYLAARAWPRKRTSSHAAFLSAHVFTVPPVACAALLFLYHKK